jgi:hypothetical protein
MVTVETSSPKVRARRALAGLLAESGYRHTVVMPEEIVVEHSQLTTIINIFYRTQ